MHVAVAPFLNRYQVDEGHIYVGLADGLDVGRSDLSHRRVGLGVALDRSWAIVVGFGVAIVGGFVTLFVGDAVAIQLSGDIHEMDSQHSSEVG